MNEKRRVFVKGNEIEVPEYMVTLPQSFIEIINQEIKNVDRIISCGVDPKDNTLYFVTLTSYVGIIKSTEKHKLMSAFPSWNGEMIYVSFEDELGIQGLNARIVKRMSTDAVSSASVSIDGRYVCELDIESSAYEKQHEDIEGLRT